MTRAFNAAEPSGFQAIAANSAVIPAPAFAR
jgi:hypothetical protein